MTLETIDFVLNDIWKNLGSRWPRVWERHRLTALNKLTRVPIQHSHFHQVGTLSLNEDDPMTATFTVGDVTMQIHTYAIEYPKSYDSNRLGFDRAMSSLWDYSVRETHLAILRVATGVCSVCHTGLWDATTHITIRPIVARKLVDGVYPQIRERSCRKLLELRCVIPQLTYTLGDSNGRWLGS